VAAGVGERPDELVGDGADEPQLSPNKQGTPFSTSPWPTSPDGTAVTRRRRPGLLAVPKPLGRILKILLFLLIVQILVIPALFRTGKALEVLREVNLVYLLVGIALEAAAVVAYTELTRAVLPRHGLPSRFTLLRIQLATLSVSHVVPGGSAAGTSLGYRLLTQAGVDAPDAGFALATEGLGSAVVLNALLWLALVVSIPLNGFNPLYLTAAIIGAILIGGFSLLILLLTRGEERAANLFQSLAARMPLIDEEAVGRLVHRLGARLRELGHDRHLLVRAISWATANWLLDAASLWVFVAAFGHRVRLDGLLVSFGLAYVLAAIPVTPGGLGVVETVLTSSLVGFGTPARVALIGVLAYRLVNFWLPIPLGGLAYLSLHVAPRDSDDGAKEARRRRREHALRRLVEPLIGDNEGRREWARRHGIKL
jgi:putative heme transporter